MAHACMCPTFPAVETDQECSHGKPAMQSHQQLGAQALLGVLEEQSVSVAKAGLCATFPARTGVVAAANPHKGHWQRSRTLRENLKLPQVSLVAASTPACTLILKSSTVPARTGVKSAALQTLRENLKLPQVGGTSHATLESPAQCS